MPVSTRRAATNLAALRNHAVNVLRLDTAKKRGIRCKQESARSNHRYLLLLLTS